MRHSLGLVEEKVSGNKFLPGVTAKGSPRILGGKAGTAPLGRGGLGVTPASSLPPPGCGAGGGEEDRKWTPSWARAI